MKIYKATYFTNGSNKIEPMECQRLTFDAVVISRTLDDITATHSNAQIIQKRETKDARFCSSRDEAVDFLDAKYQDKIEELEGVMLTLKQKQKSLIKEVSA